MNSTSTRVQCVAVDISQVGASTRHRYQVISLFLVFAMVSLFFAWSSDWVLTISGHANNLMKTRYKQQHSETTLRPPPGYPWHKWPSSGINTLALLNMLEQENENAKECLLRVPNVHNNTTTLRCERQIHFIPYIIRNGTILRSQAKREMWLGYRNTTVSGRLVALEAMLTMALQLAKQQSHDARIQQIAKGDFPIIIDKSDFEECLDQNHPRLTWSRLNDDQDCHYAFPVPSYYHWFQSAKPLKSDWDVQFQKWNQTYPLHNKKRLAGWRGSPTGHTNTTWRDVPRVQLVFKSMARPDILDAALIQPRKSAEKEMKLAQIKFRKKISEPDFMKYRAILDIDGNSWSSRFGHLLCYNSVVVKIHPTQVDYFHYELKPWKHYIPVKADMTDLEQVVEYVLDERNTRQMQLIVKNANRWCQEKMTYTQLATDLLWILVSYVELLEQGNPDWYKEYRENHVAYNLPDLQMQDFVDDDVSLKPFRNETKHLLL